MATTVSGGSPGTLCSRKALRDFLADLLGRYQIGTTSGEGQWTEDDITRYLNLAQQEVALDLRVPRRFVVVTGATSPERVGFNLPDEALGAAGLLYIYNPDYDVKLPVRQVTEAYMVEPDEWSNVREDNSPPRYAIYDPALGTGSIYIVPPHTEARTYHIFYHKRPTDLAADTDLAFDGDPDLALLCPLIAYRAAALMWEADRSGDGAYAVNHFRKIYEVEKAWRAARVLRAERGRMRNAIMRRWLRG